MYQTLTKFAKKFFSEATVFKVGFNISPMYRRSTGRVIEVSDDLLKVRIKIPLSYKNSNYVGTIFGGSLFSATDPIYMVQLINILGNDYVVWDKSAEINYRRPAKKVAFATFEFTNREIENIKERVIKEKEFDLIKEINITGPNDEVLCELKKVLYVADKAYFKEKRARKKTQ
jgi:acyl-coenzyme A thioesterase PaaI-like protein